MDRIRTLTSWQWRAYWRRVMSARNLNAGNRAIILIFSVLASIRYSQSLSAAATDVAQGRSAKLSLLLWVIFLVWMFPLATGARSLASMNRLLHLPLSLRELFIVRIITLLIPPYAWIIGAGSLAICFPILRAQHPLAGIAAALLFVFFSLFTGLTIAHLLRIRLWRRFFFVVIMSLAALAFYLIQTRGREGLLTADSAGPVSLVTNAALGSRPWLAVAELAMLTILASLAAFWSFRQSLQVSAGGRTQRISLFKVSLPGAAGGLAAKDFRYFRGLLDPYLGVLLAIFGSAYLVIAESMSAGLFQVWLLSVIVPSSALAFNLFGLDDRAGMERLRLMPLSGKAILLGKHLAFMTIVALQIMPMLLLGLWRLGVAMTTIALLEAISMITMFLAWGNWPSINHPFKMHFFQFSSSNGLVLEAIASLLIGGLPGVIAIYLVHNEGVNAIWKIGIVLVICIAIYLTSTHYAAGRLMKKQDQILSALS